MGPPRLRRFAGMLRPLYGRVALLGVTVVAGMLLTLPAPMLEKRIIDEALPARDTGQLGRLVLIIAALFLAQRLVVFARGLLSSNVRHRSLTIVRMAMYDHFQRMSPAFFARHPSGTLLSRMTGDVVYLQNLMNDELFEVLAAAVKLVIVSGLLWAISPELTLACAAVAPVLLVVFLALRARIYRQNRVLQETHARMTARIEETFAGMQMIQVEGIGARARQHNLEANLALERVSIKREATRITGNLLTTTLSYVPVIGILWLMGGRMVMEGTLTLGALLAFTQYLMGLVQPVTRFFQFNMNLQAGYAALDRLFEILDEQPDLVEPAEAVPLDGPLDEVELRDVHLRHPGPAAGAEAGAEAGAGTAAVAALCGVSLRIRRGERVALVGPSGAGKTSVLYLLLRLFQPSSGEVRVNGRPIGEFTVQSLRAAMAYLPQEVFLLGTTLRDNLTLGRRPPESRVAKVLETTRAAPFVDALSRKLETPVEPRGSSLSGGQKQRIGLGRLLLRDAQLYLLDEPTAALDPATEREVVDGLRQELRGCTVVLVAHRFATLDLVDRVVVLSEGRVVEEGTVEELRRQGGLFATLYRVRVGDGR